MLITTVAACSGGTAPAWSFPPAPPAAAVAPPASPPSPAASRAPASTPSPAPRPTPSATPSPSPAPTPIPAPSGLVSLAALPVPPARIPILYYHRVQALPADFASWSKVRRATFLMNDTLPKAFAAQLDWLLDHGYTTILPRDLVDHWDNRTPLPARPVIITFDDGSRDWVTRVMPMLKKRGMVAEFYLTLDAIRHGNLTWDEVRQLAAAGNGIGAHDVHHFQLTALGPGRRSASRATMWTEINDVRQIIGARIGVFPDSMAYVGGGYDARLQRLVQQAGYTSARSINRGVVQTSRSRFALRVVRVGAHDDVTDVVGGVLVPGLPTFAARMAGVSDKTP